MKEILIKSGLLVRSADFSSTSSFTDGHIAKRAFIHDLKLFEELSNTKDHGDQMTHFNG